MLTASDVARTPRVWPQRVATLLVAVAVLAPYGLLALLSLGSGWTFPNLLPDRLDLAPWRRLLSDRDGLLRAVGTSLLMSVIVGAVSTVGGLLIGRAVRCVGRPVYRYLMYVPFVVSPVIVGICLYDLFVRCHLAGTATGVVLAQSIIGLSFAAVFFSEMWSDRTDRLESLVRQLGGGPWDVWRHAILSQMSGLILICFVQAALYSWVDFGLASVLGGGRVSTVTVRVFACIREASVNQAALSGLILLVLPLAAVALLAAFYGTKSATSGATGSASACQRPVSS
ncbi:MAG: hypothetical protein U0992_14100 [Planctomycetaceae bacterium]